MILGFFLLLLLAFSNGLLINMEGRKNYCFYKKIFKGEKLKVSYVCSGKGESKVGLKATLTSNYLQLI